MNWIDTNKKSQLITKYRLAIDCAKYSLAGELSLISVIFQYGKEATHFIFAYCDIFTFGKLMMKIFKDYSE